MGILDSIFVCFNLYCFTIDVSLLIDYQIEPERAIQESFNVNKIHYVYRHIVDANLLLFYTITIN